MNSNTKYSKELINRFLNPKNLGEIKKPDSTAEVINPVCKDSMKIHLKIKNNKISDIKFQTIGCAAAIAFSDVACDIVKGKTLEKAKKITEKDILKEFKKVPENKIHCSLLGKEAIKKAIKNYKKKNNYLSL